MVAPSEIGGTVSDMGIDTALDGNPTWHLRSIDDVDELYSALSFSDPKMIVTPDGSVWEVWVDTEDETMQLHRLSGSAPALTSSRTIRRSPLALNTARQSGVLPH
jgi:hypothetical protein